MYGFVLAVVFVLFGCENSMDGTAFSVPDTASWAVTVRDGAALKAALENGGVGTVEIASAGIDAQAADLDIETAKSIIIPPGRTLSVRSLNAAAHVVIRGAGTLKIGGEFSVEKDAVFEIEEGSRLAFGPAVSLVRIDGILRCGEEGAVYALEGAAFSVSGAGRVELGGDSVAAEEFEPEIVEDKTPNLAAIGYRDTVNKSSGDIFDMDGWTGSGGAAEGWTLRPVEKPYVYFAVTKAANQTLRTGDARVSVSADGSVVDGTTTGDTLAVVTVDLVDKALDGGEYSFEFAVLQDGQEIKTIDVTVHSGIDDTYGVTIFRVRYPDGVETLENLNARIGVEYDVDHTENPLPVDNLYNANRWLEFYGEGGTEDSYSEYLIRLNRDQETKPIAIVMKGRDYVKLRLRGAGGERRIYRDIRFTEGSAYGENGVLSVRTPFQYLSTMGDALIALFPNKDHTSMNNGHLIFVLEKDVTIDGNGKTAGTLDGITSFPYSAQLLALNQNTTVIMKEGSKISGYLSDFYLLGHGHAPVYVSGKDAAFIMEGGVITGNTYLAEDFDSHGAFNTNGVFVYSFRTPAMILVKNTSIANTFTFTRRSGRISGNIPDYRRVGYYTDGAYPYQVIW